MSSWIARCLSRIGTVRSSGSSQRSTEVNMLPFATCVKIQLPRFVQRVRVICFSAWCCSSSWKYWSQTFHPEPSPDMSFQLSKRPYYQRRNRNPSASCPSQYFDHVLGARRVRPLRTPPVVFEAIFACKQICLGDWAWMFDKSCCFHMGNISYCLFLLPEVYHRPQK